MFDRLKKALVVTVFRPRLLPILFSVLLVLSVCFYANYAMQQPKQLFMPDDYGYVQYVVKHLFKKNKRAVVVLGGSSGREAIMPPEDVTQALSKKLQRETPFFNLSSSSQTLAESLGLLSSLAFGPDSLVILIINAHGLSQSTEETIKQYYNPRLPFLDYSEVKTFLDKMGAPVSPLYFWSKNKIWLDRMFEVASRRLDVQVPSQKVYNLQHMKAVLHEIFFVGMMGDYYPYTYVYQDTNRQVLNSPKTQDEKQQLVDTLAANLRGTYLQNKSLNMQLMMHILNVAKRKKARVVFLLLPRDPIARTVEDSLFSTFKLDLEQLKLPDYTLIDYSSLSTFNSEDFYDLHHMMPSGREKFNPIFLNLVTTQLEKTA